MVVLKPYPDELCGSHFGRVWRLSGKTDFADFVAFFRRSTGLTAPKIADAYILEMLAIASQMSFSEYISRHTMTPFERALQPGPEHAHGTTGKRIYFMDGLRRVTRRGAMFCSDCISLDHASHGMSYWRREHHLDGTMSCQNHERPLSRVEGYPLFGSDQKYVMTAQSLGVPKSGRKVVHHSIDEIIDALLKLKPAEFGAVRERPLSHVEMMPLLAPPSKFLDTSHLLDSKLSQRDSQHRFVREFLGLSRRLLNSSMPIDTVRARGEIQKRWMQKGFRTYFHERGSKPLLSDWVQALFPAEWLMSIYPSFSRKVPGTWFTDVNFRR